MTYGTFSVLRDVVLFLLAIYAAILSTFNYRQAAKKDLRAIQVTIEQLLPRFGGMWGNCYAKVEAVNAGHRPVTITRLTLEVSGGSTRLMTFQSAAVPGLPDTQLPAVLSDGQTAHVSVPYADIGAALADAGFGKKTKLIPLCEDTLGNVYRGDAWEVDPHELMQM